ncbi:MAG: DUF2797 domain-containing protein [Proteobacteria bacterium]|nr:DUF2797 domain-containing protein [Pseudomonadota bacterium]MBU1057845.1 DUF2797 domain-containing protein [Pseudomonadota bacterium]
MIINTNLKKLIASNGDPIQYQLSTDDGLVLLNDFIGKELKIEFTGKIYCKSCGKLTKKSFAQGFCFPCFRNAPEAAPCIIRPELCRAHLGEGRDIEWEQHNHNQPHVVYLAISSAVKVGVTKDSNIPTRWIDQGASYAVTIAHTPNRYLAGEIEVELKELFTDRTHWQKMLRNEVLLAADFQEAYSLAQTSLTVELRKYLCSNYSVFTGRFPVLQYPSKIISFNPEKSPYIEGVLTGIKGQYLMFDAEKVINIRKFEGYEVVITS